MAFFLPTDMETLLTDKFAYIIHIIYDLKEGLN